MAHPLPVKYYFVSRLNTVILDVLVVFTNLFKGYKMLVLPLVLLLLDRREEVKVL